MLQSVGSQRVTHDSAHSHTHTHTHTHNTDLKALCQIPSSAMPNKLNKSSILWIKERNLHLSVN